MAKVAGSFRKFFACFWGFLCLLVEKIDIPSSANWCIKVNTPSNSEVYQESSLPPGLTRSG